MAIKQGTFSLDPFADLPDPRSDRNQLHSLRDIVFLTICAVTSGADSWVEVEQFGYDKEQWLRGILSLKNGIPSHDTLGRFYAALDPKAFEHAFILWVKRVVKKIPGEVIPIDGKTIRRSYDKGSDKAAIHMVSAWASGNGMVIGQIKTNAKSNEITAIPALLNLLAIEGCIVTIDAMGCQKEIVAQIRKQKADYLIAVKDNQPTLLENIKRSFSVLPIDQTSDNTDAGHGRNEFRKCDVIHNLEWMETKENWKDLHSIVRITSTRHIKSENTESTQVRYYITSMSGDAEKINQSIRTHWEIQGKPH